MNERCSTVELELAGFAAGELEPVAADAVARHVARCAACRAELDRELALRETLAGLPRQQAPAQLGARPAPAPRRRPTRRHAAWGLAAAALLVALLAALPRTRDTAATSARPVARAEATAARRDAVYGLVLAARILEHSEKSTVVDVFGRRLPRAVTESLRGNPPNPEGGQG